MKAPSPSGFASDTTLETSSRVWTLVMSRTMGCGVSLRYWTRAREMIRFAVSPVLSETTKIVLEGKLPVPLLSSEFISSTERTICSSNNMRLSGGIALRGAGKGPSRWPHRLGNNGGEGSLATAPPINKDGAPSRSAGETPRPFAEAGGSPGRAKATAMTPTAKASNAGARNVPPPVSPPAFSVATTPGERNFRTIRATISASCTHETSMGVGQSGCCRATSSRRAASRSTRSVSRKSSATILAMLLVSSSFT
mmetsp:Transcript_64076/g.178096  ORF Transcript_64076/g.178096 Transcript_64076/m.178096 type:complete len:253 (-) Transcript_64076:1094-1852(-)